MSLLRVSGVSVKNGESFHLKNISFSQDILQNIGIAGETGSGKTSLLKIIGGLMEPESGKVFFRDEQVMGPNHKLIPGHPGIAFLSQYFELRNNYRVEELLEYANNLPGTDAEKLFRLCRIDHLLHRKTDQLSGGEKQRIAIARLLIGSPKLLLLDEPYSNLDMGHKALMKEVIREIDEHLGITSILVSHDPGDLLSWAHKIIVLRNGEIIQLGTPIEIYTNPVDEYVAGLFGKYNIIKQGKERKILRPEQITITEPSENSMVVEVFKSSFFGSYYEVEVSVMDERYILRHHSGNFLPGDRIHINLPSIL